MLLTYVRALVFLLSPVRGSLMELAALVAGGAAVTAFLTRRYQTHLRASRPQAKILQWRPRTITSQERRAA